MTFAVEPPFIHGQPDRTGVLLVNLGSPQAPTPAATRRYLRQFLSDPRVVEIPRALWWLILHGIVLRLRPARSARKYAQVWSDEGAPLLRWTQRMTTRLVGTLGERGHRLLVRNAMRYGEPSIASQLDALKADGATRVLVLPLYPQYAAATTASVSDAVAHWALNTRRLPELRFVNHYHDHPGYIEALAASINAHWLRDGRAPKLVMSFHGLPARSLALGDPYHCQCLKTARLLAQRLGLGEHDHVVTFQSRFGKARWLEPYTLPTLRRLASEGVTEVDVVCPGFAADCLETLEEVALEARAEFLAAGGKAFHYIACLNDQDRWIQALADLSLHHLQGWPTGDADSAEAERSRQRALAAGATR